MQSDDNMSTDRERYYESLQTRQSYTGEVFPVPFLSNSEYTKLRVYEIPIGDKFETKLRFNVENSRIIKHVKSKRALGEKLNPEKEDTQEVIKNILLNDKFYSKRAVEDLKQDLINTGQREPAIISCDGVIWNGNRRIAILSKLFEETGDSKYSRVKAVFLPRRTKKQLTQLEYRLQLAKDFKLEYDRLNLFLLCRERIRNEKWSYEELSNSFRGRYNKRKIEEFIKQIDLIDEYLVRIGKSGNYDTMDSKGVEIFTTMQDHLDYEERKRGEKKPELEKIKNEFFSLIKHPDSIYLDARFLGKVLKNEVQRKNYLENSLMYNNYSEYIKPDDRGVEKTFSPDTASQVLKNVRASYAELKASEIDDPIDLAAKALKKLEEIKSSDIEPEDTVFANKIDEIIEIAKSLRSYVKNV